MVTCPKCKAQLPDWAQSCQFCHTDVAKVARPVAVQAKKQYYEPKAWVWGMYYAVASYFCLNAFVEIFNGVQLVRNPPKDLIAGAMPIYGYVGIIFGLVTLIVGTGLLLKIEFIRGIVNFFCGLTIIFGVFDILQGAALSLVLGFMGFLMLLHSLLNIATAGAMIYLIGETDRGFAR